MMNSIFLTGITNETSLEECGGGRRLVADDCLACLDFLAPGEATGGL
jgi:hypothetical protein